MPDIEWNKFEAATNFVKLIAGKPKIMKFASVKQTTRDVNKDGVAKTLPALEFEVTEDDGAAVSKVYQVTSKRLITSLRPFVERGFPFRVQITQFGAGFNTEYQVQGLPTL